MDVPVPRRLHAGRQQHRRPVDAVEADDVLADEVHRRPPLRELRGLVRLPVAGRGDVVRQRVEPDVGDVALVPRDGHAPLERRAADREVEQAALDEPQHLVAPADRVDDVGVLLVPLQQPVLEAAQPEEVVLLLQLDDLASAGPVVLDLVGPDVLLVRDRVPAPVGVELDVAGVVAGLQQLGDRDVVARLGGADEVGRS